MNKARAPRTTTVIQKTFKTKRFETQLNYESISLVENINSKVIQSKQIAGIIFSIPDIHTRGSHDWLHKTHILRF